VIGDVEGKVTKRQTRQKFIAKPCSSNLRLASDEGGSVLEDYGCGRKEN